ncbi:hypothetical protein GCM10007973_07930 [Polymorphobacter multimanifer]|nr:hypothetical protein GCM10007973_07930 [Polymorphobacter multimanifer]
MRRKSGAVAADILDKGGALRIDALEQCEGRGAWSWHPAQRAFAPDEPVTLRRIGAACHWRGKARGERLHGGGDPGQRLGKGCLTVVHQQPGATVARLLATR